jgi:hypothetical protein
MRKLLLLASLATILGPAASSAQVTLGLRFGAAFATGDAEKNAKLADAVTWQLPIQADALWPLTPDLSLGVYGSYGFGFLGDPTSVACDRVNASCSASSWRLGVQAEYGLDRMHATVVPWVAVGTGWEWLKVKSAPGGGVTQATSDGWELVNLQLGGDYKVSKQLAVGPYVQYAFGRYTRIEGVAIPDTAFHGWLGFGIRGRLDI